MNLLTVQFPSDPVTSSLLGPNIFLSTPFSNILSLCSTLNVRDQISQACKTTDKITVLYIFKLFIFRQKTRRQNILNGMVPWDS